MTTVVRDEVYEQLERDLRADLERLMLTLLDRRETLPPGVLVCLEPLIRTRCLRGEFREALELTRFLAEPLRPLLTPQRLGNFQYRYGLLAGRLGSTK